ncbi:MAG: hypothetical protein PHC61_05085 [Chitinivibrionales bacterium]|nr:hypothetical protein [Chitinivibrionales bacterium]
MRKRSLTSTTVILFAALFTASATVLAGSDGCYGKGMLVAQAGIGLGFYGSVYGNTSIPPLAVAMEYGYNDLVSLGGGIGIEGSSYNYSYTGYNWSYTYTYIPIMFRAAFHPFNLVDLKNKIPARDKWDAYGGLTLGWTIVNFSETQPVGYTGVSGYSAGASYPVFGLLLGTRYYFSPKFGVFAEEGSGFGWLTIGVVYKL